MGSRRAEGQERATKFGSGASEEQDTLSELPELAGRNGPRGRIPPSPYAYAQAVVLAFLREAYSSGPQSGARSVVAMWRAWLVVPIAAETTPAAGVVVG